MNNSSDLIISQLTRQPRLIEMVSGKNGKLTIEENESYRWIRDDFNAYYSILDKFQPGLLVFPYLQTMMAALIFVPEPKSSLILGAGGGALLRFLNKYIPDSKTTAIDYDATLIQITEKYFLNEILSNVLITQCDVQHYLDKPREYGFDLVFVDLFALGEIPDFFYEIEFYEKCKKQTDSGVVVFNLIITNELSFKKIFDLFLKVFNGRCLCLTVDNYKNIIVLAFSEKTYIQRNVTELRNICQNLNNIYPIKFDCLIDEITATNITVNNELQI